MEHSEKKKIKSEESTPIRWHAIAAMASNRVIGRDGQLPWRISKDLQWFKRLTVGHPVLMGRKTMESLGKPLPKRKNFVLSRSLKSQAETPRGFIPLAAPDDIQNHCPNAEIVFVIGGAQIYRLMFPRCQRVYLSRIFDPYPGDTELPEFESDFELREILHRDDDFELLVYQKPAPDAESL